MNTYPPYSVIHCIDPCQEAHPDGTSPGLPQWSLKINISIGVCHPSRLNTKFSLLSNSILFLLKADSSRLAASFLAEGEGFEWTLHAQDGLFLVGTGGGRGIRMDTLHGCPGWTFFCRFWRRERDSNRHPPRVPRTDFFL